MSRIVKFINFREYVKASRSGVSLYYILLIFLSTSLALNMRFIYSVTHFCILSVLSSSCCS